MNHLQPPGSPLSPLSPPSPPMTDPKTIYDVIYSSENPPEFYGHQQQLVKAGACPHLVQLKQKLKHQEVGQDNVLENYRSLVRYSLLWHKSRKHQADHKKRKHVKEASATADR
jgi:ubiquitin carboxyl-terminal hydrolase 22/27/51